MAETVKFDETTQDQPNSTSGNVSINVLEVDKYPAEDLCVSWDMEDFIL